MRGSGQAPRDGKRRERNTRIKGQREEIKGVAGGGVQELRRVTTRDKDTGNKSLLCLRVVKYV